MTNNWIERPMAFTLANILATVVGLIAAMAAAGASAQAPGEDEITRTGTIAEDLFLFADTITVRADVTGEVAAMGGEVDIRSTIEGDVVAMGGELSVGDAIVGNVLATGGDVATHGRIDGDITAMGGNLSVDGVVSGDVLAFGGRIVSDGEIGGKLRLMGGEVLNRAVVLGSVLAAGARVELQSVSRITGKARLAGAKLVIGGTIGDDLQALGRSITIAGQVAGDVTLQGVEITILPSAKIGGNLTYRSGEEADIDPAAEIAGDIIFIRSEVPARMTGRAMLAFGATWLVFVASLILLGTVQVLLFPNFSIATAQTISGAPWKSLGLGLAVLVGGPVVMAILAVTVIGLSLTIVLGALYLVAAAFAYIVSAVALGRLGARLIRKQGDDTVARRIAAMAAGLLVLSIAALVPGLGPLATLAAFIFGLGALVLRIYALRRAAAPSPGVGSS